MSRNNVPNSLIMIIFVPMGKIGGCREGEGQRSRMKQFTCSLSFCRAFIQVFFFLMAPQTSYINHINIPSSVYERRLITVAIKRQELMSRNCGLCLVVVFLSNIWCCPILWLMSCNRGQGRRQDLEWGGTLRILMRAKHVKFYQHPTNRWWGPTPVAAPDHG